MEIRLLWIIILGYFFVPTFTYAEQGDHAAGLMVGQVWPSGEIGKDVDSAVAPGIFYEYSASEVFDLYTKFVTSTHSDGRLKLQAASLSMKAHLVYLDQLSPYAILGAGLYFVKKEILPTRETAKKTLFGVNLGVGAELDLSERFFMAFEFTVHNLFSGSVNLPANGKTEISGRSSGFFLKGGVRF